MTGPLSGIKVLDLSRILAGPWATQVLADFGAEVVKIEKPLQGDDTRHWGPPFLQDLQGHDWVAAYFLAANRGKSSLTLDISQNESLPILHQLVKQSDVLVENFRVGALKKYQLDYESLRAINPRLVYCSITGYGQTGPDADKAGYDAMVQAKGGLMSLTGAAEGEPGDGPQKVGVAVADLMTGMYAVGAITAALYHREKTGQGQSIDLALFDTQVAWLANQSMNYWVSGQVPKRQGSGHPNIVPYQAMACKNGHFMLAVGNDRQFSRLCQLLGLDSLSSDPRYCNNAVRVENRASLVPLLETVLHRHDSDYWLAQLEALGVPCGPINDLAAVFAEPQLKARQMLFDLEHPQCGSIKQVANPVKFSTTQISYQKPPPALGEQSQQILSDLGLSGEEIGLLRQKGVI